LNPGLKLYSLVSLPMSHHSSLGQEWLLGRFKGGKMKGHAMSVLRQVIVRMRGPDGANGKAEL
jgi:hypothetical protein